MISIGFSNFLPSKFEANYIKKRRQFPIGKSIFSMRFFVNFFFNFSRATQPEPTTQSASQTISQPEPANQPRKHFNEGQGQDRATQSQQPEPEASRTNKSQPEPARKKIWPRVPKISKIKEQIILPYVFFSILVFQKIKKLSSSYLMFF